MRRRSTGSQSRQVLDVVGDWAAPRPGCGPAAGRFNTRIRITPISTTPQPWHWRSTALTRSAHIAAAIDRAAEWVIGMQSRNGGWGVLRRRQHALLPQPYSVRRSRRAARSADAPMSAPAALGFLAQRGYAARSPRRARGARPICGASRRPTAAGSAAGAPITSTAPGRCWPRSTPPASTADSPEIRRAVGWLHRTAARDGGWGEAGESYWPDAPHGEAPYSTASQTAWALLGADGGRRGRAIRQWRAASLI